VSTINFEYTNVVDKIRTSFGGRTAEVAHTWQYALQKAIEKFVHLVARKVTAQPMGMPLRYIEVRNGLLARRDDRLLAGDLAEFLRRGVKKLHVLAGFAEADVTVIFETFGTAMTFSTPGASSARGRLIPVFFLHSALHFSSSLFPVIPFSAYLSSVVPQRLHARARLPSESLLCPMRVCLPQLLQTSITFEALMPASFR